MKHSTRGQKEPEILASNLATCAGNEKANAALVATKVYFDRNQVLRNVRTKLQ
jgi:hypothetical protein